MSNKNTNYNRQPSRILIVRTDRLGDVILSTPVIKNLRLAFPNAHLAFMCRPYTRDVVTGNPWLDEVIILDKKQKHRGIWGTFKLATWLRRQKFDWALILHPALRAHLLIFLSGIPVRVGWDKKIGCFLTKRIPHTKQEGKKHEVEYTLDILRAMHIPVVDTATYFPVTLNDEKTTMDMLLRMGYKPDEKLIIIHPSASCPSRRWPYALFSRLIKLLQKVNGLKIVVISSAEEADMIDVLVNENTVIDLRGRLSISQFGALLKHSALLISNDSGPVHIAAALGTPVISLFSRKNPGLSPLRWGPVNANSFYFHKNVGCDVCLAHNCKKGFICLDAINPEEVASKAFELLSKGVIL